MGVQNVNHCLCGCSLKTGTTIIGTLSTLHGGVTLFMLLQNFFPPHEETPVRIHLAVLFAAILAFCQLVMGILLVMGADRSRPQLIRPWLLFSYFRIGMDAMASVYGVYLLITHHVTGSEVALYAGGMAVGLGLEIYCIMVVYSFYKQLVEHGDILPLKEEKV